MDFFISKHSNIIDKLKLLCKEKYYDNRLFYSEKQF